MNLASIHNRIEKLSATPVLDETVEMQRQFLRRLTLPELRQLKEMVRRYQIEHIAPTKEEERWLDKLQHGHIRPGLTNPDELKKRFEGLDREAEIYQAEEI